MKINHIADQERRIGGRHLWLTTIGTNGEEFDKEESKHATIIGTGKENSKKINQSLNTMPLNW